MGREHTYIHTYIHSSTLLNVLFASKRACIVQANCFFDVNEGRERERERERERGWGKSGGFLTW